MSIFHSAVATGTTKREFADTSAVSRCKWASATEQSTGCCASNVGRRAARRHWITVDHGRGWKGNKAHNQVNEVGVLFGGRCQQRERATGCAQGNQDVAEERQILLVAQGFDQAVVAADDCGHVLGFVVLFLHGLGDKELHRFQFVAGRQFALGEDKARVDATAGKSGSCRSAETVRAFPSFIVREMQGNVLHIMF